MPWSVLPMRYATIVPQHAIERLLTTDLDVNFLWMQTKCDASLDFSFLIQMLFTRIQMRNVHMMQMSHAGVYMQSLFMMMLVHAFKPWCKYLLIEMEMQMSSNGHVMMQMPPCGYVMMRIFWRKHNLFKNSLCFQNQGFLSA